MEEERRQLLESRIVGDTLDLAIRKEEVKRLERELNHKKEILEIVRDGIKVYTDEILEGL